MSEPKMPKADYWEAPKTNREAAQLAVLILYGHGLLTDRERSRLSSRINQEFPAPKELPSNPTLADACKCGHLVAVHRKTSTDAPEYRGWYYGPCSMERCPCKRCEGIPA